MAEARPLPGFTGGIMSKLKIIAVLGAVMLVILIKRLRKI